MRPRHGGNLAWAAARARCSAAELLDFSASINPLGPPLAAIAAIQTHIEALRSYPDPTYHQFRQALAQVHQLPADWILPGNGCAELLTWVGRDLANLPLTHLLTPAFGDYQRALTAFAGTVQSHPLNLNPPHSSRGVNRQMQDAVADCSPLPFSLLEVENPGSTGVLLNTPHNPTGQRFDLPHYLTELAEFGLVVVDEAFIDFLPPGAQRSLIPMVMDHPHLVILRSLTKFYSLAGLRLGYAIAHPERLQRWLQWRDPWPVNALAIAAGIAVLQDQQFQQQTWDWLPPTRAQLFEGLSQLPGLCPFPSAANFLLVQSNYAVTQLQTQLLQHHRILIRDCLSFAELGDRYFRVAVRTESENQALLDGLAAVLPRLSPASEDSP